MAVRLQSEMTSSLGINYRFRVYDGSYGGAAVSTPMNDFELTYSPSDDTLLSPIITSELTLNLYDDGTTGIAAAITSIETSDEENIEVTIERDTGGGYELEWVGIVQKEGIVRYNTAEPIEFTLRATDGLNLLKDIRYPGIANGTHTGSSQIMQFITECLKENGLDSFWGSSDAYIRESIEWTENNVSSPASDSPILYTRCDVLKFRNEVGSEDTTNKTCYEVIEGICNLFGAQFFHANGCYYLRQPRNHDGTTHTERQLSKGLTELSSSSVSNDCTVVSNTTTPTTDQVRVLGGGAYMLREPLDIVRANVKPGYLLPIDPEYEYRIGYIDTGSGSTVNDKDKTFTVALGTIYATTSPPTQLEIIQELDIQGKRWEFKVTWTVNLGIGTYYLDWDSKTNTFSWNGSAASYIDYKPTRGNNGTYVVRVITPPIPAGTYTLSTLTCRVEFWDRGTGAQPSDVDIIAAKNHIDVKQPEVRLVSGSEEFKWDFEANVQNPTSNDNSKVLDLGDVWFNDNSVISTKSMFEVNTTGSTWAVATTWDAGYDTDTNLSLTHLYERMSYQISPVRMYRGPIEGFYRPHLSWIYSGETYVMRRLTHKGKMDEYDGDWWRINQAVNGIDIGDKLPKDIPTVFRRNRGPRKEDQNDDRYFKLERIGENGSTIDKTDSITSIDLLRQVGHDNIKDDDTIGIVHPLTGEVLQTFTVDGDVGSSDTSISVDSDTADYDYNIGFYIVLMEWETKSADVLRGSEMRIKSQSADSGVANRTIFESSDSGQLSYKNSSGVVAPLGEMVTETALSQAQIQSLDSTPVQLIGTAPSGYYYDIQRITIFYDHNGTEYSGSTGTLEVHYAASSTRIAFDSTDIFLETADYNGQLTIENIYHNTGLRDLSNLDNSAIEISNTVSYTGAGGTATVRAYYKIVKI